MEDKNKTGRETRVCPEGRARRPGRAALRRARQRRQARLLSEEQEEHVAVEQHPADLLDERVEDQHERLVGVLAL